MKTIKILLGLTTVGTLGAAIALSGAGCSSSSSSPGDAGTDTGTFDVTTDTNHPPMDSGTGDTAHPGDSGGGDTGTMGCSIDAGPNTGQIDRMGRAAINTALNLGDDNAKNAYNQQTTFQDWSMNTTNDTNFNNNLQFIDSLDGMIQWTPVMGVHPLTKILEQDALFVYSGSQCTTAANSFCEGSYLSVEVSLLTGGAAPPDCGGRTPHDSATNKTLTALVGGASMVDGITTCTATMQDKDCAINDKVTGPTKLAVHTFPYLAAPN